MTAISKHQSTIVEFARNNNNLITKKQACELIPFYYNTQKHVGDILSRMVKNMMLLRIKNGVYKLNTSQKNGYIDKYVNPNQSNLF